MIDRLQNIFQQPLPGEPSQLRMSPSERNTSGTNWDKNEARNCSVLIMLYFKDDNWYFPLIKRPSYDGAHSGQISLPGGKWESTDASPWEAAVRETIEETGVCVPIRNLGSLTPLYIPFSNFMVHPFVGCIDSLPCFEPDMFEVDTLIEAPLSDLLLQNISKNQSVTFQHHNRMITAPCYNVNEHVVWGATAMMLSEFLDVAYQLKDHIIGSSHSCNADSVPESLLHTDKVLRPDNSQI